MSVRLLRLPTCRAGLVTAIRGRSRCIQWREPPGFHLLGPKVFASFQPETAPIQHARYFSAVPDEDPVGGSILEDAVDVKKLQEARKRRVALRRRRKERQVRSKRRTLKLAVPRLHRRSAADFELLFDQIAPHTSMAKIGELTGRVKEQLERDNSDGLPLITVFLGMLQATNPNNPIQIAVLEFHLSISKNGSYEPAEQPEKLVEAMDAVSILTALREVSIEYPLGWRKADQKQASSEPSVMEQRKAAHVEKTEKEHQDEARHLAESLADKLTPKQFRALIRMFDGFFEADADHSGKEKGVEEEEGDKAVAEDAKRLKPNRRKLLRLRWEVEVISGAQYHLIANEIADFFYLNVGLDYDVTEKDDRVTQLREKWFAERSKFATVMMDAHEKLLASVADSDDIEIEEDAASSETDGKEDTGEPPEEKDIELKVSNKPKKKKSRHDQRFSRPTHVKFGAIVLNESTAGHTKLNGDGRLDDPSLPPRNLVFVDNLPIDITEEELTRRYVRLGELDSVQIFNQRPDLDPGPLTLTQRKARRKTQLRTFLPSFRRWQRPRTPVHGLLSYAEHEGCRNALDDSLRIFGMMIHKHPARSISTQDMTRLYIEDIPEGKQCMELEFQLSQKLQPDLFVCLESGQSNRSMVGSCEIQFPTFEHAWSSYAKLLQLPLFQQSTDEPDPKACKLNWIRAPRDAEKWWTRKRGFD